jgi:hypothetical protein
VSLEESFHPKFAHQQTQKTTIQIPALEGKAALRKKLGLERPALNGITNPSEISIRSLYHSAHNVRQQQYEVYSVRHRY